MMKEQRECAIVVDAPSIPGTCGYQVRSSRGMAMVVCLILNLCRALEEKNENEKGRVRVWFEEIKMRII